MCVRVCLALCILGGPMGIGRTVIQSAGEMQMRSKAYSVQSDEMAGLERGKVEWAGARGTNKWTVLASGIKLVPYIVHV